MCSTVNNTKGAKTAGHFLMHLLAKIQEIKCSVVAGYATIMVSLTL